MPGFLNFLPIVLMIVMLIMLIGLLGLVISDAISEANLSDIFSWRFQKRKDYIVADNSLCDMLEIILSDLNSYNSRIDYYYGCLSIDVDIEAYAVKSIVINCLGEFTIIKPEKIKFPKSREKTLKNLIKKATLYFEEERTNKKLMMVKNVLSEVLTHPTKIIKTPEVLDIDE